MKNINFYKELLFFFIVATFLSGQAIANDLSYIPQIYLGGYVGNNSFIRGDILTPVYYQKDKILFLYGQGNINFNDWKIDDPNYGSFGLGYRQVIKEKNILGAYIFGDYNTTANGNNFWVISPGIESLGKIFDFRANGYFPIGNKSWVTQKTSEELERYNEVFFPLGSNEQYTNWYQIYERTGVGFDSEVGISLFNIKDIPIKGYVQGYYYDLKENGVVGGGGVKITAQLSNAVTISANDTYDNYQHNVFSVGVQIKLNELFSNKQQKTTNDIHNRLTDQIDRNLWAGGSNTTVPVRGGKPVFVEQKLERKNIVFAGTEGNVFVADNASDYPLGSYGNPYIISDTSDMQEALDYTNQLFPDYSYVFLAPGEYHIAKNILNVHSNQGLWGRTYDFKAPAYFYGESPTIYGTISLSGDYSALNEDYALNSLTVYGTSLFSITPEYYDAAQSQPEVETIGIGIKVTDSKDVKIDNVTVKYDEENINYNNLGIIIDDSEVTLTNSQIYSQGVFISGGILVDGNSTLNLGVEGQSGSNIIISSSFGDGNADVFGIGAFPTEIGDTTIVNFNGGNNTISTLTDKPITTFGIDGKNQGPNTKLEINFNGGNNTIKAEITNEIGGAIGILLTGDGDYGVSSLNFNGGENHIFAVSADYAVGIYAESSNMYSAVDAMANSTVNFNSSNNEIYAQGRYVYDIMAAAGPLGLTQINFNSGGNIFLALGDEYAYNIYANGFPKGRIELNFNNSDEKNIFQVDAKLAFGIEGDIYTLINIDGDYTTDLEQITDYVDFYRSGDGYDGYMIYFEDDGYISW